jgi:hypothetical protein
MYIANGKHFDNYEHLENWCIDNGMEIGKVQAVSQTIALAQVIELDKLEADIRRERRRAREAEEQAFAVERKYYGR